jgi:hypothetical protein
MTISQKPITQSVISFCISGMEPPEKRSMGRIFNVGYPHFAVLSSANPYLLTHNQTISDL